MKRKSVSNQDTSRVFEEEVKSEESSDNSDEEDGETDEEEYEMDGGEEGGMEGPPPAKLAKLSKGELYKPPTNEELTQLKETENLFQSSLFRLQISELLNEVLMQEKQRKLIDKYLHQLKDFLTKLPELNEHELCKQKWLQKKNVQVPFVQKPFSVKGKFRFLPPGGVRVVGSYLLGTSVYPNHHVDLAVLMPKECIQAKDHLNQRYLRKRALYLTCLAWKLKKADFVEYLEFTYLNNDHLKPVLLIQPTGKLGKKVTVRVHVSVEEDAFKLNRFHISKNNIRTSWYNETSNDEESQSDESQPATPVYNTVILTDLTSHTNLNVMHAAIAERTGLKEGVALLKVWLHQRELDVGYCCFSGFVMTMFVVYLLKKKKLNPLMSSYQVVRNTLMNLRDSEWCTNGVTLCEDNNDPHRPYMEDFHKAFDVVFVDSTGYVNLCAGMTTATYNRVLHEARQGFSYLEDPLVDGFDALFMKPVPFIRTFDQLFHVTNLESLCSNIEKWNLRHQVMDLCGHSVKASIPALLKVLQRALDKRIKLLCVKPLTSKKWSVDQSPPQLTTSADCLTFGILLDGETAYSVLDKGPPADSDEAKEFRQFWGEKSELRRFQDGSICEAVVWPCNTLCDRRRICGKIFKHILERHANISRDTITCVNSQLDSVLKINQHSKKTVLPYGTGEEQHVSVLRSYDELAKILRSLKELPLLIHSVQGTSPVFRYSQVFPAIPATYMKMCETQTERDRLVPLADKACPVWTPAMTVICTLEGSGKWPDDKEAIRRVKAAFLITLSRLLERNHSLQTKPHVDHLDVFKDGYVFRLELAYIREITVLKTVKTPEGMVKTVDTEEAATLEQNVVALPKLSSTLHGIQQHFSSYSVSVRVALRWVASQLLADHVPQEAVELIMAHIFLSSAPFSTPNSPIAGFVRFLGLLSSHDWKLSPLIVNLNNELKKEDVTEIHNNFTKMRDHLPLMFIATPYDKLTSLWTKSQPSAQILQRLVLLAHQSLQVIESQVMETSIHTDFKQIFRPPLDAYDVLIHLNTGTLARHYQAVDVEKNTYCPSHRKYQPIPGEEHIPVIDFDPVRSYLTELRDAYSEVALFFHDPHGGALIAVLWKPKAFQPKPFKVMGAEFRMIDTVSSGDVPQLVPNVKAIIEDFKILGEGLVKNIVTKS